MKAVEVRQIGVEFRPYLDRAPTLRRSIGLGRRRTAKLVTALDDVTFSIDKGDSLAVIGANGAGKSTLLRVLARTLRPDRGQVEVRGNTSALLQLGSGFNAELSGRRNVMLAGLAAGMSKRQILQRYDDIIAYAELDNAIDRAVKTYSSGMFSRLAFSVAVHLDPEILLVDEVLAVGDEAFRQKSERTMAELLSSAGTLVFVTHSLNRIPDLCPHTLWLDRGRVRRLGASHDVIEEYRASVKPSPSPAAVPSRRPA